jgi:hypothetical protein
LIEVDIAMLKVFRQFERRPSFLREFDAVAACCGAPCLCRWSVVLMLVLCLLVYLQSTPALAGMPP